MEKLKKFAIHVSIGMVIVLLLLLFQNKFTIVGWANATIVTGVLFLSFGWMSIVLNHGLFDLIVYSVTSFWGTLFGKRKEKDFYTTQVEKVKIDKSVYFAYWFAAIPFLIASLILHLIYLL